MEHLPRRPRVSCLGRLLSLLVATAAIIPGVSGARSADPAAFAAPPLAGSPSPGAAGIGDPYYPLLGNGGYDVVHYTLDLDLDVEAGSILEGIATIEALATHSLSTFNLDYRGPAIAAIAVNEVPARWRRLGGELTITPAAPLEVGTAFTVAVRYAGIPDGGEDRLTRGWWASGTAIATIGEPTGAEVWYPVNGHPLDKATYTLSITVPESHDVVANGRLVSTADVTLASDGPSTRTFVWENRYPTASYLVTFHAADLEVAQRPGPLGITLLEAIPPDLSRRERRAFERVPQMLVLFARWFGPYPFAAFGGTVLEDTALDAALETQELVTYDRSSLAE
ncbi:MAG TPA: hypothetical protein VHG52_05210, partial [Thermomicrobiales bacterium]|nr:hypothetical protein [Thermomicrobiales bacterium]